MKSSVSVVITCFNLQNYISLAIESALSQRLDVAYEVIVVDDASTDSSVEIISRYPSVRLVRLASNQGVLAATLAGIRSSQGDLIFFLDGDDTWHSEKLRLCTAAFNADIDVGIVTHDLDYINANGLILPSKTNTQVALSSPAFAGVLVKKGILCHSDYVWLGSAYGVRRSKIRLQEFCAWAEKLDHARETYQDWPLAYWAASLPDIKCAYVSCKLMSYRIHSENHSGDARTVEKALRNLRKSFFTAIAICHISEMHSVSGFPRWMSRCNLLYYSYMLSLYSDFALLATIKFFRLQIYFIVSPNSFVKEWIRFLLVVCLGASRFTSLVKA